MANKQHAPPSSSLSSLTRSRSPVLLLFPLALLALSLLFFSSSPQSPPPLTSPGLHSLSLRPETSFLASLDRFLATPRPLNSDDTAPVSAEEEVRKLDDKNFARESDRLYGGGRAGSPYFPVDLPIRVYVYNMPSKFTYDLLWLFKRTYSETDNLTSNGSPVHRLIEQHSIDYWIWADLIAPEDKRLLKDVVVRVDRQESADLFYIPFFTTISFFLLEKQQCKALYRVKL